MSSAILAVPSYAPSESDIASEAGDAPLDAGQGASTNALSAGRAEVDECAGRGVGTAPSDGGYLPSKKAQRRAKEACVARLAGRAVG
jgi:hypothetical protein